MAFAATSDTTEPRSWSVGPFKCQRLTWSAASADVSGTVTADALETVEFILIPGLELTAAPTYSGNTVTLAFTDPAATVAGTAIVFGR